MDKIFQQMMDSRFSDLEGLAVDASIPIPQSLINEMIETALQENRNIESCQVDVHGANKISLHLKTPLWPWPLNLKFKLDESVDLASFSSPKIRMWLENNQLLGRLGSFFNAVPEGVKLYGDQVVIDVGSFLHEPDQKWLLDLIKFVGINTEEGKVILDVKIKVD